MGNNQGNNQGNQNNQYQQPPEQQPNPEDQAQQQQNAANHWLKKQQEAQQGIEQEEKPETEQQQESNSQQIKQDFQTQQFEKVEKQIDQEQEFKQEQKVNDQENLMDQQFYEDEKKEQQVQQEEVAEYTPEQVESIWLSRTFKIFVDQQEMNGKQVDFIAKDSALTIEYLINEVFYQFLISKLYSEEEKLNFLLDVFQSLSSAGIEEFYAVVAEGNIPLPKFEMLLNHVQENLITCILYPEGFEWQKFDENPNNLDDKRNQRADQFYNAVFCSQYLTLSENMLDNFLEYLENKSSLDDAHKLLDLMLKRELYLNANLSISNNEQQLKSLRLLQMISKYPKITETLLLDSWGFGKFSLIQTGKQFQVTSLIGKILSLSGFFTDGQSWQQYFANDQQQMTVQMNSLRNRITVTDERVVELFTSIMKKPKLRHKFFEFLSKIIYLNLNLEKSFNQALQTQCSTPGMMFNLQYILMKIFNPWISDGEKINNAIQKIDKNMLSYIKKHPYFAQIYQNIDFLHPEATPFVEPEEFSTKIDNMTVLFLLTQRVNHIVAATLDQYYYNFVLKMLNQNVQQFGQQSPEVLKYIKYKVSLDAQVLCTKSILYTMDFLGFSSKLALSLIDEHNKPIYPFGLLASSFVNDIHSFFAIYNYNDQALNHDQQLQRCCEFAIVAMNTRNIANPHLRIKGIELFHIFDENRFQRKKNYKKQQVADFFRNNHIICSHIIGGLLKVFIDSERTGDGNQFYEKFSFRYQFCKLIRYLLEQHKDIYKDELTREVQQQKDEFLNFANFYLNDMIYLLDESLSRMKELKELEANLTPENKEKHTKLSSQLKTYTLFLKEYYQNIQVFSEVQPEAFLTDEIRDKLVNNLNYTIEQLNGKNALQYKIQSFESVNFDPKFIMGCVIELYLNFSQDEKFLLQVVRDERCFSIELFERTIDLMDKYRIIPDQRISLFKDLIVNLNKQLENYQSIQVQPDDVPQDFLDPLCCSIMTDPVKLPHSNVIVDRLTIKKQLLNQQIDPFDRSPLTIDMVIEQPELKQKIAKYIEEVKRNKQKLKQQE